MRAYLTTERCKRLRYEKKNISPRVKPRKRSNGLLLVMTANEKTSALFTLILDYQTIAKGLFKNCFSKSLW